MDSDSEPTSTVYNMVITKVSNTVFTVAPENGYLGVGTYAVRAHSEKYGYAISNPQTVTIAPVTAPSLIGTTSSSFAGGKKLTITGAGFHEIKIKNNDVRVCGQKAEVVQATQTSL